MKKNGVVKKKVISTSNKDAHYKLLRIEPLIVCKANLSEEEYVGYLKGTAHKYLMRHPHKGKPIEDLEKCKFFIDKLIEVYNDPPF